MVDFFPSHFLSIPLIIVSNIVVFCIAFNYLIAKDIIESEDNENTEEEEK